MEIRGRTEGAEELCNPIGRSPTVSTNPDLWELPETEPPTKEHTWAGPRPGIPGIGNNKWRDYKQKRTPGYRKSVLSVHS